MKRFLILTVLVIILPVLACAQSNVHYRDTATIAWDDVTADANGVDLAPPDVMTYDVFLYDSALSVNDQDTALITNLGSSTDPEFIIDFTGYDRALYWAGVRSVVTREDLTVVRSVIVWSYDEVATNGSPFGYVRQTGVFILPAPSGLMDSGI